MDTLPYPDELTEEEYSWSEFVVHLAKGEIEVKRRPRNTEKHPSPPGKAFLQWTGRDSSSEIRKAKTIARLFKQSGHSLLDFARRYPTPCARICAIALGLDQTLGMDRVANIMTCRHAGVSNPGCPPTIENNMMWFCSLKCADFLGDMYFVLLNLSDGQTFKELVEPGKFNPALMSWIK